MIGPIHPGVTLREDFMEPYELRREQSLKGAQHFAEPR